MRQHVFPGYQRGKPRDWLLRLECPGSWSRGVVLLIAVAAIAQVAALSLASASQPESVREAIQTDQLRPLPLAPLLDGLVGSETLHQAIQSRVVTCMEAQGFDYTMTPYVREEPTNLDRRYGIVDLETAQTYGYAFPLSEPTGEQEGGENPGLQGLTEAERRAWGGAFFGTSFADVDSAPGGGAESRLMVGGCLDKAESPIYGDRVHRLVLFSQLEAIANKSYVRSRRSPKVVSTAKAWSRCMQEKGYQYPTPEDLRQASFEDKAQETAVAVAEATCHHMTKFGFRWNAAEIRIQRRLVAKNEGLVLAWQEQRDAEERRAARSYGVATT